MGGSLRVAVRFQDGTTQAATRWTNNLSMYVRCQGFVEDPDAHLRKYIAMESPYREEGDNVIVPYDYGLVVFDVPTLTIYTCNGYTGNFKEQYPSTQMMCSEEVESLRYFIAKDKVALVTRTQVMRKNWSRDEDAYEDIAPAETQKVVVETLDEITRQKRRLENNTSAIIRDNLVYDLAPWTVRQFIEGFGGERELHNALVADGFPLSDVDRAGWVEREAEERRMIEEMKERGF